MNFIDYLKENTLQNDSGEYFELNEESLKKYFNLFNEKYFNNELPPIELKLTTIKDAKNKYAIGDMNFEINTELNKIKPLNIIINNNRIHVFNGFRNTLVHEMIHYWVILNFPPNELLWKIFHKFEKESTITNPFEYRNKMYEILHLSKDKSHEGKWQEMADKLNNKFKELNVTIKGNGDEPLEKGFLEKYLNTHTLFLQKKYDGNKCIHIVYTDSSKYKEIMEAIKLGESSYKEKEGKWYKLNVDSDEVKFEKFIVRLNLFDEQIYSNTDAIDAYDTIYEEEFLGTIKYRSQINERMRTPEEIQAMRKEISRWIISIETGEIEYKDE